MSAFNLLANAIKVHECLEASVPGRELSKSKIAERIKRLSGEELSIKQVGTCISFLEASGFPTTYDEEEHRWFYEWNDRYPRTLIEKVLPRLQSLPHQEFGVLLMLRHGLEQLRETNLFESVRNVFDSLNGNQFCLIQSQLDDMISYRRRSVEPVDENCFQDMASAVYERQQVEFFYQKIGDSTEIHRKVNPHHLTCYEGIWYVLAWDLDRGAMRTFALTRMREIRRTSVGFETLPREVILKQLDNAFGLIGSGDGVKITVRVRFDAWSAMLVRERRWHESLEITTLEDGGLEVEMKLGSLFEVEQWVLGWGEHARVLEPQELIDRVVSRTRACLAQYP